jgi:multiple sugar transport system permease protein
MSTETVERVRRRPRNGVSAAAPAAPDHIVGAGTSDRAFTVVAWVVLVFCAVVWLIPSLWAVKTSLTSNSTSAVGAGPILTDWSLTLDSYTTLLSESDLWNWYLASAITSVMTVLLVVVFALDGCLRPVPPQVPGPSHCADRPNLPGTQRHGLAQHAA